jgi:enoyl-CoA hydratase/carnithine racemase
MDELHALYRTEGHIAIITLNRPGSKNAFSPSMTGLLRKYLEDAKADNSVRVITITGSGDAFSAGGDIRDMVGVKRTAWELKKYFWEDVYPLIFTLEDLDKPVIAAVNGAAMGAGMDLAMMCDLRVCSDKAKFGEAYVMMGLVPDFGGAYFLPRLVSMSKTLELLLTGDMIGPDEALRLGLVNRVVAHDRLMEETMALAQKIADKPPLAIPMIKRAVYQSQTATLQAHLDYISSQLALLADTKDHKEAATAFLERRKPVFEGK